MDCSEIGTAIRGCLEHRAEIAAVYLFGSHARGTARATSDVDLGVIFSRLPSDPLDRSGATLASDLSIALGRDADVEVASHIVADERLGEPRTNHEMFEKLRAAGWIGDELASTLRKMVGFRNILVHGYSALDPAVVEDAVRNRLDDFDAVRRFVAA